MRTTSCQYQLKITSYHDKNHRATCIQKDIYKSKNQECLYIWNEQDKCLFASTRQYLQGKNMSIYA